MKLDEREIFQAMAEMYEALSTSGANPGIENMCKLGTTIQTTRGDNERRLLVVTGFKALAGDKWDTFCAWYGRESTRQFSNKQCGRIGGMLSGFWRRVDKRKGFRQEVEQCAIVFNREMGV